jgi:hypothetical protein
VAVRQPLGGELVGALLQVDGVPKEPAADFEDAGEAQVARRYRADVVAGHRVDGDQGDDEPPERVRGLVDQAGERMLGTDWAALTRSLLQTAQSSAT